MDGRTVNKSTSGCFPSGRRLRARPRVFSHSFIAAAARSVTLTMDFSPSLASSSHAVPSGLAPQTILLDSDIRDWVVLPLLVIMISAGLLRHHVGILLRGKAKPIPRVEQRSKSDLQRASRIRSGSANFISTQKWQARRDYYSSTFLREEAEWAIKEKETAPTDSGAPDPMNPMSMMDGMMGNMAFMVQNMVMMQGISHFFKGYVLVKIPFPLTQGFKGMFQRGLELQTLDTSYVSSVSWYFLVMYGLRGFFRLVIGDPSQEQTESIMLQSQLGTQTAPAGPAQFDAPKMLKAEGDNLELLPAHKSSFDDVEKRLLGNRYPKKKLQVGDDLYGYGSVGSKKKK